MIKNKQRKASSMVIAPVDQGVGADSANQSKICIRIDILRQLCKE